MEKVVEKSQMKPEKTTQERKVEFDNIIKLYLDSNPILKKGNVNNELEIRFGTNRQVKKPITKIEYDNVVQQLYSNGFKSENVNGNQLLRIQCEYVDKEGRKKMSNVRAEITGTTMIQEYCKTNSIQKLINMPSTPFNMIKFTEKKSAYQTNGDRIEKVDMPDFNFRVSFQTEKDFHTHSPLARQIISKWDDSLKIFRSLNRVRFYHEELPIFVDLSIVKSSKKTKNKVSIPKYTIQEAEVFEGVEEYEIEIEVDNTKVSTGTQYENPKDLANLLRKSIRMIMCGIQQTNFPISYKEKSIILNNYVDLFRDKENKREISSRDFIGPSSYTLELENVVPINKDSNVPNIRENYTVTDKADGDRKLMYISDDGKIYLIDTNMNVTFTGAKTSEKTTFETLIDGEHIKHDKNGKFLNLYAAFDIYFIQSKSVRELEFINNTEIIDEKKEFRLHKLKKIIDDLKIYSILDKSNSGEVKKNENSKTLPIYIKCKEFLVQTDSYSIFNGCSKILSNVKDGVYEYNTDGLIFTPSNLAVGANKPGDLPGPLFKIAWENSFKWKPPEFNTIDFLVSIKKDNTGKDEVHSVFQTGKNTQGYQNVLQYKTLILRCGFNEKKHGFINPFNDIINDNIPSTNDIDETKNNMPVAFQPTNPFDENAKFCNMYLKEDGSKSFLQTEEGEYFEENMIVEFKYEMNNEPKWRWKPLRVRYDKTADLRKGEKNFGNAYHVANSNWHSIHNPVTEEMITTDVGIPEFTGNEDIYYNNTSLDTNTQALRDFHNRFVKSKLILGVSNRGNTLIDYAVGKAGDLPKWIRSKLKFVFGIDLSKDNIMNQLDGACARYLKSGRKYENLPNGLFVHGNSGKNIRNGDAYFTEKDKQISKAVFGSGTKDATILGKGVYKNYGVAESGFQISSCQFALHYFFENEQTLHSFLRNLTECTKVNGYFIGTCYDGKFIFDLLKDKKKGESMTIFKDDYKMYELTKQYDHSSFPDDELSLSYGIDVFQETINKVFREYLINFDYLTRIMEDYGFVPITKEEATQMKLPNPVGLFSELFTAMENEIKMKPDKEADYGIASQMSVEEKKISFMNKYFVFKKVRNVDAKKMEIIIQKQSQVDDSSDIIEKDVISLEKTVDDISSTEDLIIKPTRTIKIQTLKK
tara:strand:- start:205 stop:3654 length:3450 start_codon:yes stop_codon:yes gene_type:complete